MDETDFEGTLVLEQLAAVGKVEEFFDAIDSDDVLGWGWVSVFVVLDVVAIVCALSTVLAEESRFAQRALLVSIAASLASFGATVTAIAWGFFSAQRAVASSDPTDKARRLAEGISTAMNGAAFGTIFTVVAGVATVVCLLANAALRAKSRASPDRGE
jgi:NAD(P)-dependent dehydrogenase (short-subunit alcohol dehydrogenase family)